MLDRSSLPLCVSGMGSLMNIHTVAGPVHSPADLEHADPLLKELLFHELVDRGIYLAGRGYMALSAAITDADCDRFVDALTEATRIDRSRRHGEGLRPSAAATVARSSSVTGATGVIAPSDTS